MLYRVVEEAVLMLGASVGYFTGASITVMGADNQHEQKGSSDAACIHEWV
jgi:hypothetical protein